MSKVPIAELALVASLWGVTNPLMKQGAEKIQWSRSTALHQLKYFIYFIINQLGSLLYVFVLQRADLSIATVTVNPLTFIITAMTGAYLGERKVPLNALVGMVLVSIGTAVCCLDKMMPSSHDTDL